MNYFFNKKEIVMVINCSIIDQGEMCTFSFQYLPAVKYAWLKYIIQKFSTKIVLMEFLFHELFIIWMNLFNYYQSSIFFSWEDMRVYEKEPNTSLGQESI